MLSNLEGLTVEEVMRKGVRCLDSATTVKDAARFFLEHGISGAPVTDGEGKPVGVLTLRDLTAYLERHLDTEDVEDIDEIDLELAELRKQYGTGNLFLERLRDVRVEQIMTPRVLSVHDDLSLERAIRFMTNEVVHRLFVTDEGGRLVGVLSTSDIVRALGGANGHPALGSYGDEGEERMKRA